MILNINLTNENSIQEIVQEELVPTTKLIVIITSMILK